MIRFNVCPVTLFQAVKQELVHTILASVPRRVEGAFSEAFPIAFTRVAGYHSSKRVDHASTARPAKT